MVPRDEIKAKMSYSNHKYFTSKKKGSRSLSKTNRSVTSTTKRSREVSLLNTSEVKFLGMSNRDPSSLFQKLRSPTSQGMTKDFISNKNKIQKLRHSSKSSKGSVKKRKRDLTGSYPKFNKSNGSFAFKPKHHKQ